MYKIKLPIKNELTIKLNLELTETIKTTMDKIIFHFCSFEFNFLKFPNKYNENITADEHI